ncbi:hypothetical protein N7528_009527 [Penicillium herquei]|nr:hypothetical protein N7528_009527 [Penicillium herquei]
MAHLTKDSASDAESLSKNAVRSFPTLQRGETMTFDMEVQEDIPAELEAFVILARLELFQEAEDWFEKCLSRHRNMFPVLLEYADMLLQGGSYSKLVGILNDIDSSSLIALGETSMIDAMDLLQFMKTFANLRLKGKSEGVMSCAIKCWERLKERFTSSDLLGKAHVHMIEIYLGILSFAFKLDSYVMLLHGRGKYTNPPWTPPESPPWSGFCDLYTSLKKSGSHWEAQRLQSMLLPVVTFEDIMSTFIRGDQFDAVAADIDACQINPSVVLSELIISNRICNYLLEREPLLIILAEAFLNASRSLKAALCENSRLGSHDQARPFLQVDDLEELLPRVRQAPMSYAAERGHGRVIKLLIEKGLDIEATDSSGRSPLSYAAEKGHSKVMSLLMQMGADIEKKDSYGRSPLSWAAENGLQNVIRLLTLSPQVGKQSSHLHPLNAPPFRQLNTEWQVPWAKEGFKVESLKFSASSSESFDGCAISPGLDVFALWTDNKIVVCRTAFLRAEGGKGAIVRNLPPNQNGAGRLLNNVSLAQKYCASVWKLPPNQNGEERMLKSVSLTKRYLIASTTGNFQVRTVHV